MDTKSSCIPKHVLIKIKKIGESTISEITLNGQNPDTVFYQLDSPEPIPDFIKR